VVARSLQPGSIIDGFRLDECIHRGDMAAIWRVSQEGAALPLVMKMPNLAEGEDPAAIVSFEMEQLIMPRLSGIHVPQFVAAGDFGVQPYIVMEQIPGSTLLPRVGNLPLPYPDAVVIALKIAQALDDLHRQHVIHLDVKPSNVMFRPSGEAVLLDFGLSHHDHLPDLMQEEFRVPFGTAPYISPEQLLGIRDDPRSDLFAAGALLYFFSTGVRPFGESERLAGMRRRLWRDPDPPRRLRPAMASGNRVALPRDRAGLALPDRRSIGVRFESPRSSETHQEV
jgi:serine/threonine protein kinase